MLGCKVVAKIAYCGHTVRAEAEVNRKGQWIGRGVVVGCDVEGAIPLTAPLPTPAAALDATLAAGRQWVDERRGAQQEGSGPA